MKIHPAQPKFNTMPALEAELLRRGEGAVLPLHEGGFALSNIIAWFGIVGGVVQAFDSTASTYIVDDFGVLIVDASSLYLTAAL